ncbi:hypothetical protein ACFQ1M_03475 [Sungkyunkwania multivorans]|uniref:Uncharacterized protein n=1 Tax=Sungkyunkwania multivorans TaxID=1173618 RepID=A0ABW3CU01_9FLAO
MTILESLKKYRITLLLFVLIFISLQLLAGYFRNLAKDIAATSFQPYEDNATLYSAIVEKGNLPEIQRAKTLEVLAIADGHKKHHEEIALNTFRFRYMTVTMLMICSILVAALLLYITPKGWNQINDNLKAVFLLLVAHSAFYGGSSVVYGQEATLEDNVNQYVTFDNIQKGLITSVIRYQLGDSIARDTLIIRLNRNIAATNEKIMMANDIKFNLQEYKATTETLKEYLKDVGQ